MKPRFVSFVTLFGYLLSMLALPRICGASGKDNLGQEPYLTIAPVLALATLDNGYGMIPFSVRNNYTTDLVVSHFVDLMTSADSGEKISIEKFRRGPFLPSSGPKPVTILLKPGETGTFGGTYSMETLAFLVGKDKEIFGRVSGHVAGEDQEFQSYSDAFPVPRNLATPPWLDLGERNYFTVIADTTKIGINPHRLDRGIWLMGSISVPISVKNTAGQAYIAGVESVSFYIDRNDGKRASPSPWETIKTAQPILKPGESAAGGGEMDLDWLQSQNYKAGDKLVAAVGGRIPDTNQIFESYSAPFELPPLPKDKPPKGALQIPGL
jgi:hypothetical protein